MASPLPILELNVTSALGGGPKAMADLVGGLARDRFAPVAVTPDDGPYFAQYRALGVPVLDLPMRAFRPGTLAGIVAGVRRHRVRLIHSHGKGAGLYGRLAAALTRVPAVHTFHGLHHRRHGRLGQHAYLALERLLARLTTAFVHVSSSEMEEAIGLGVSLASRAVVIPNGVDCDEIDRIRASSAAERAVAGLAGASAVVGYVARISPQKGLEDFARAMRLVADAVPGARFVLVGDAPKGDEAARQRFVELVGALGLDGRLLMLGYRSDAIALMKTFDVYVSTALWEGLPITLLEAMACRRPIVATDVGGNRDVVVDGDSGFLVPVRNPDALAGRVRQLLEDPALRRRLGEAGRRRVEDRFSIGHMVARTSELYERVAQSRGASGRAAMTTRAP
jgi:glycosyltransferase involved in cell wall biosynthesis